MYLLIIGEWVLSCVTWFRNPNIKICNIIYDNTLHAFEFLL